uniref:Uncharacterized protein n=1 Tax=Anguilla anguilla TaxID=7936 RepID=A0A0E9XVD1_ANGAN
MDETKNSIHSGSPGPHTLGPIGARRLIYRFSGGGSPVKCF